jgi:oligoendopeptidase F
LRDLSALWDLEGLIPGGAREAIALAEDAVASARRFAERYRGRIASLDAAGLAAACAEIEAIITASTRSRTYATLRFDADMRAEENGSLLDRIRESDTELAVALTFFDLEWIAVEEDRAQALLADQVLARYAHSLREVRRSGPYRLSEAEERVLSEKALTGATAWARLLDEELAGVAPCLDGEDVELDVALAQLQSPERPRRVAAAAAITAALEPGLRLRARILGVLVTDRAVDQRLRGFAHWLSEFNLDNEISDGAHAALVATVEARADIPRRWMRLKARALGLPRLAAHDVLAPLGAPSGARTAWDGACEIVGTVYASFSQETGAIVERFLGEGWIDAAPRPGKRGGAFCMTTVPDAHPFVLLNFAGTVDDVLSLAHELGHGVHAILAAPVGVLSQRPSLALAETASVFGETLTFAHLRARTDDPATRLGLLAAELDAIVATLYRQMAIHRFEYDIRRERAEAGELTAPRLGELWLHSQRELLGEAVEVDDGQAAWWSYISHIFRSPGYVYTYAFGQLLALTLLQRYREAGESFVAPYLDILRAGGSREPAGLLAAHGMDIEDPAFWAPGLEAVDRLLDEAEAALAG